MAGLSRLIACHIGVRISPRPRPSHSRSALQPFSVWFILAVCLAISLSPVNSASAATLDECREQFATGQYHDCLQAANDALAKGRYEEGWRQLKLRALLATGGYSAALTTLDEALSRFPSSIELRFLGREVCLRNGLPDRAKLLLSEIDALAQRSPWRYTDAESRVILGRAGLLLGGDARLVLEGFYERAMRQMPNNREAYLAIAELALDTYDSAFAAEILEKAVEKFPDDADVHFLISRTYAGTDPARGEKAYRRTLELNPNHVAALLFHVERLIDAESYPKALMLLDNVDAINPRQPEAWAYRAVLAHLNNDPRGETAFRAQAFGNWQSHPVVESIIGRKLSQKYRFAEGAAHQRRALAVDPQHLPAQMQLAQDLLRLGVEDEGWQLAETVFEKNGYNVAAFNLMTLRDNLNQFATIENDDFIIRMDAREADIFGDRVQALLMRAKRTLCEKYGLELTDPVTVEIFPDPADFAVRTFGMPGGSGYLGVCFGKVITANSPASQAENPANWEAVLWHEFCHVVTLELTGNKLPRWLSEGISVYEERQEDPRWGQNINPQARERILHGGLTPIAELSGAFLNASEPGDLSFAYLESSLVVEFLMTRYSLKIVKDILQDLAAGLPINVALDRHTDGLNRLEIEFIDFAAAKAEKWGGSADWDKPEWEPEVPGDRTAIAAWVASHPDNWHALRLLGQLTIKEKDWDAAEETARQLIRLCPGSSANEPGYRLLAEVYKGRGQAAHERAALEQLLLHRSADVPTSLRLIELARTAEDQVALMGNAERLLAVNPLLAQPYPLLAEAAEKLHDTESAIVAYQTWLKLDADDPALAHYRLATLLHQQQNPAAHRHVLKALEQAPRYRAAYQLLLEIERQQE